MSAAEMKAEVENHMKKKVAIESVLPTNIMIGPFYVNTDGIRQGVAKKHRALANAVLDLLAKKLRLQAEEASSSSIFLLTWKSISFVFSRRLGTSYGLCVCMSATLVYMASRHLWLLTCYMRKQQYGTVSEPGH